MLIRVITVGTKPPAWVDTAVDDYSSRMPAEIDLEWKEIRPEPRSASGSSTTWMAREAQRIRQALPSNAWIVALDERGKDLTTLALAKRLEHWRVLAQPVAILIGGADGIDMSLRAEAHEQIRLSSLTLPHMLVRVVLAEQLFRAWSVISNHPYHRP